MYPSTLPVSAASSEVTAFATVAHSAPPVTVPGNHAKQGGVLQPITGNTTAILILFLFSIYKWKSPMEIKNTY